MGHLSKVATAFVAMVIAFYVTGCEDTLQKFVDQVNAARQAANGNLQKKRGLLIAEDGLARLQRPNFAIAIDKADLPPLESLALDSLRNDAELEKQHITFKTFDLSFQQQAISATAEVEMISNIGWISGRLAADFTVSASGSIINLQGYFRDATLTSFKPADTKLDMSAAVPAVNALLSSLVGTANAVFDKKVNAAGKLRTRLDFIPLYVNNFRNLDTAGFQFDERDIKIGWWPKSFLLLVDEQRLLIIADLSAQGGGSEPPPIKPEPLDVSTAEVQQRLLAFQKEVGKRFNLAFGSEFEALGVDALRESLSFALISKALIAETVTRALAGPPICASGSPTVKPSVQSIDIEMPSPGERKCDAIAENCRFKNVCENPGQCVERTLETVNEVIKVPRQIHETSCRLLSLGGVIKFLKRVCDDVVRTVYDDVAKPVTREVMRPISTPVCSAFRETRKITPLFCDAASNISKAVCDVANAPGDGLCVAEQGLRSFAQHNPIAVVETSLDIKPNFKACVADGQLASDFRRISGRLNGQANANVGVDIKWDNKAPILCHFNWKEGFKFDATATLADRAFVFDLRDATSQANGDLLIRYKMPDDQIRIDLNKSPLDEIFVRHPQLIANCPLLTAAGLAFGAYDTIVNEKFKRLSGYMTGKGVRFDIPDLKFEIKIPPLLIGKNDGEQDVLLRPRPGRDAIVFIR